jgi:hypothetical protein
MPHKSACTTWSPPGRASGANQGSEAVPVVQGENSGEGETASIEIPTSRQRCVPFGLVLGAPPVSDKSKQNPPPKSPAVSLRLVGRERAGPGRQNPSAEA